MDAARDFAQLQRHFVDRLQWRYELIRPLVLFADRTPKQRAEETQTHVETVRDLTRRFQKQGILGLLPDDVVLVPKGKATRVPPAVVEELARLKTLSPGFAYRELARSIFCTLGYRMHHQTIKKLWQQSPGAVQEALALGDYHRYPERYEARVQVIKLFAQGWTKRSISHVLQVSRPTLDRWIHRFAAEHFAGLEDKSRAPKTPARKVWFALMIDVYHLQKRHPAAGEFRIWSLLARTDIAVRTVGRIMALNREVYEDLPGERRPHAKQPPQPHPYKASHPHEFWCIDGRQMDFALEGVKWWSLIVLDGYSRTMLAGAVAPTEASWVALMALSTACLRYGVPKAFISDSGGAFTSNEFEAVCTRLQIDHKPMESTKGESYLHWMETHFHVQRRLYDYQCALTTTPAEFERAHQAFMALSNTTAHQGLLQDQFDPPIPLHVLGEAKGRMSTPDELTRKFSRALFPRTTNQHGCVTLHSYHCYIEAGVPKTQVLLWVYGEQLRAVLDKVVLAEYHCRYDWRDHKVKDSRQGVFYPTRFASSQGSLIPLTPQESLVLYRPQSLRRPPPRLFPAQQLWLFELVRPA